MTCPYARAAVLDYLPVLAATVAIPAPAGWDARQYDPSWIGKQPYPSWASRNPPLSNREPAREYCWGNLPVFSRSGSLLPSTYAAACYIDAVIVLQAMWGDAETVPDGMSWTEARGMKLGPSALLEGIMYSLNNAVNALPRAAPWDDGASMPVGLKFESIPSNCVRVPSICAPAGCPPDAACAATGPCRLVHLEAIHSLAVLAGVTALPQIDRGTHF